MSDIDIKINWSSQEKELYQRGWSDGYYACLKDTKNEMDKIRAMRPVVIYLSEEEAQVFAREYR